MIIGEQRTASRPDAAGAAPEMTSSEAEIVRRYDRQRRQRLLILLGTMFGGAIGILFLLILVLVLASGQFGATGLVELVGIAVNGSLYVAVVLLARDGRVEWASALFAVGAGILPNLNILSSTAAGGASPFNVVFLLGAIVIVSFVGQPWVVLGTALFSSITTVYLVDFAPYSSQSSYELALHQYLVAAGGTILPVLFVVYWGMALLLLAQWRSFQRLLLDLAEVRVQVERARRLDELKDQFIRTINHELRTPIMTLLGYIDLLMNPENRGMPEKVERYVQRASRAGQSLRRLLASILDTRRLDTLRIALTPERLEILPVLEEVIQLLPVEARQGSEIERTVRVRLAPDLGVWAEPVPFQQVLVNLLSNAVKYSDPGSPIEVTAQVVASTGSSRQRWLRHVAPPPMVEVAVRDYGLGVPPEQQPLLFQRFTRLPRELESPVMGTGLGLYLCRTMVERMGGTIRVESTGVPGEGSTFLIRLPIPPSDMGRADLEAPLVYVEHRTWTLASEPTAARTSTQS
jgi:signal transduction histidine kinase